jgi:hypothetical protein
MQLRSEDQDFEAIRKTAHKIVPSTRQMGFEKFTSLLKQLEVTIEENGGPQDIALQVKRAVDEGLEAQQKISDFLQSKKSDMS